MIRWDRLGTLASGERFPCNCVALSSRRFVHDPCRRVFARARVKALAPVLAPFPLLPSLARKGTEFESEALDLD